MHEMALCESMLQILEAQGQAQGFYRVKRVRLEVGALSCVEEGALRFHFEVVSRGSLAEGAVLELIPVPGQGWCRPCGRAVAVTSFMDTCPHCHGPVQVSGGDGLQIRDLEVA